MTGRVNILWCIFKRSAKKLKMNQKNIVFSNFSENDKNCAFLGPVT